MNEISEILKVDGTGRVRMPREKQEEILEEFERSGMTGTQFSRHVGVKYPTLMNWVQRRRRERMQDPGSVAAAGPGQWIEAVVQDGRLGLVVEISGGVVMRIGSRADSEVAAELLRKLGYARAC